MEFPKRKKNRLPQYCYGENNAYFITICVKNRDKILSDIVGDDAHIVPKEYGAIVEKYIHHVPEIEKYVIMPDHIHMIISINNGTVWDDQNAKNRVSAIVRSIKTLATKEIGKSIFQRSYYDHVIRNVQDYRDTWEYIENNPMKWMLMHRASCFLPVPRGTM